LYRCRAAVKFLLCERLTSMSDTTESVRVKSENSFAAGHLPMPKIEFLANLREFAEEAMAQTRGNYERIETVANEMLSALASTQSTAAKSIGNYRTWMIKVAHGNVIAAFDFAQDLSKVKSVSDVVELVSAHARARYDALAIQTKELNELSRTFVTEMTKPINTSIANARKGAV
jgi:phasin